MNTRLKIVCVLFGIIYFYFVGASIYNGVPSFIAGFNEGSAKAQREHNEKNNSAFDKSAQTEIVFFQVKPLSGSFSFPSSVENLKTGIPIQAEFQAFIAKIDTTQRPLWIKAGYLVFILLAFPMLFAIIFIPIQIYRVIRSIVKNEIFNHRNVKRIRWIGYCLLFIFAGEIYGKFIYTAEARALVQLEDYRIVFKMGADYYWLLFALVTFMFAEILKISHTMKEEQDLTI